MGWDGPILTDSGGFQVFSLRDTIAAVDDDGVTFRSVYDGAAARFTPESVAAIQAALGSDIAMCLDICPPADVPRCRARGGRAPHDLVGRAAARRPARRRPAALRHRAGRIRRGAAPPLDRGDQSRSASTGYALGGLAIGEERETMFETTAWAADRSSRRTGRATSWASATRKGMLEVDRARGRHVRLRPADANGPHGQRAHLGGAAESPQRRASRATPRPLDESCPCPACTRFSRAYIRHLLNQEELLGLRLLSLHNLRFVLDLTASARVAIEQGRLGGVQGRGARPPRAARPPEEAPVYRLHLRPRPAAPLWFVLIRPQRRRQQEAQRLLETISSGRRC